MSTALLLLLYVSVACSLLIRPRQNYNASSPVTTTGLEYASACIQSKLDWANSGSQYASDTVILTSSVWSNVRDFATYDTITSLANSTVYSLCDGWPRLNGTTKVIKQTDWRTATSTTFFITTSAVSTAVPAPNCTIVKSDCDVLYTSWSSEDSAYNATISAYESYVASANSASVETTIRRPVQTYVSPICGSPTPNSPLWMVGPNTCVVNDATVQLLYWPVTRQPGDLCRSNASLATIGPTIPGKPNTVEYEGTTLTSPTVYIALDGTWQLTSSGTTFTDHTQVLLPQMPTDVSSMCGNLGGGYTPQRVDYADFEGPAPANAYRCQPRCFTRPYAPVWVNSASVISGFALENVTVPESTRTYFLDEYDGLVTENLCSTIWDDYRPALSIPPEFSTMSPIQHGSFGDCGFLFDPNAIFYDPPKALIQRTAIVEPTSPGTTSATPPPTAQSEADPGSAPDTPTPTATQRSNTETEPPSASHGSSLSPSSPASSVDPIGSSQSAEDPGEATMEPVAPQTSIPHIDQNGGAATGIVITATDGHQVTATKVAPARPAFNGGVTSGLVITATDGQQISVTRVIPVGPAATAGIVITAADGHRVTAIQAYPIGPVVIGSAILTLGQSTQYDGIGKVVVDPTGLSIDGNFHSFSALVPIATPGAISTYPDGAIFSVGQASASGLVVIGSATLLIGQSTSIAGVGNVLVGADDLVVNGKHTSFSTLSDVTTANGAYFVVAGMTFAAHATSAISLAPDATLWAGGPAVSLSGHVYSMGPSGAYVVADGKTRWPTWAATPAPALTLGGTTYAANQASGFVIDGKTLSRGGAVVVDGTTVSLDPSGQYVVVDGITQRPTPAITFAPALALGGTTHTANQASAFVIDGMTLSRGGAVVVDETTIFLDPSGQYVVVDGVTQSIVAPFATATTTLGRESSSIVQESPTGTTDVSDKPLAVASFALSIASGKPWAMILLLSLPCAYFMI
jgi:hypothetical protein